MAGIDPEALALRVEAAQALIVGKDYQGAIIALEAVVADAPEFEFALRTLGYIYHEVGRGIDSIHMLERALEVEPMISQIKNAVFFRTQVALRILEGLDPNQSPPKPAEA